MLLRSVPPVVHAFSAVAARPAAYPLVFVRGPESSAITLRRARIPPKIPLVAWSMPELYLFGLHLQSEVPQLVAFPALAAKKRQQTHRTGCSPVSCLGEDTEKEWERRERRERGRARASGRRESDAACQERERERAPISTTTAARKQPKDEVIPYNIPSTCLHNLLPSMGDWNKIIIIKKEILILYLWLFSTGNARLEKPDVEFFFFSFPLLQGPPLLARLAPILPAAVHATAIPRHHLHLQPS